jgi:two-component system sensor histidine kinase RpfC
MLAARRTEAGRRAAPDRAGTRALLRLLDGFGLGKRVRPDHELGREQGQAMVRLVNSLVVFAYLIVCFHPIDLARGLPAWFVFSLAFIAFTVWMLYAARRATASSPTRRLVGIVSDVAAISYVMVATGTAGIPLFFLYLINALGNGLRFGIAAMRQSTLLGLAGFSAVVALSPAWRDLPVTVPIGVFLALVLLPLYATHLIRQLAAVTRRAEEASAAKSHFIARMSHELRTPLTGILGTAELLETNKRFTREDRALLRIIKDSVKVSMRQIDNVLDFSKIEAGKLAIEQVDFDLHEVLNRAVRLVRTVAAEKELRLMLRIDPALPFALVGDPHHLNEILLNLLSNAIKFTERGYVALEAHLLAADEGSALVRFEVHDTGIGMDPDVVERIFDAFSQADTSTTRRYGGTGLGTTIAKQLVELMGGRLDVASVKGKGSVFSAEIRFARQPQHDARGDAVVGGPLAGARVLLLSTEPALLERLTAATEGWGVTASAAGSIADALGFVARAMRLGNPVHAVLADSRLVFGTGGEHAAADFLEKTTLAATPVFLLAEPEPDAARLRQWGYAGALSYALPSDRLFNVLHASYTVEALNERGVVQVEPWAWGQSGRLKPRVLVADDNRTNLMILRKILERANFEVETAENGDQALEMLQRNRYKVAVLDMHMPGRDGVDVMREYRFSRHGARTPIIVLTANATMDAKVESADAGADAYLIKPATASDVLSTIKKVLDDTQVHELRIDGRASALPAQDAPLLNAEVLADLDRLYGDPDDMRSLMDTFEGDSRRLLQDLRAAIEARDQPRFRDLVHALKGNAANIGAVRLVQVCYEAEHLGVLEIHRDGRRLLEQVEALLAETLEALRRYTLGASAAGPVPKTPAGPEAL